MSDPDREWRVILVAGLAQVLTIHSMAGTQDLAQFRFASLQ